MVAANVSRKQSRDNESEVVRMNGFQMMRSGLKAAAVVGVAVLVSVAVIAGSG